MKRVIGSENESKVIVQRYAGLDILKAIAAFLIVCIHCPCPGEVGEYFTALTRVAVPLFFMITGFFYHNTILRENEVKQIKKIFGLMVGANVLYLIWECFCSIWSGQGIGAYLLETFTIKSVLKLFMFNDSPFGGHLWYLGAILYTLLVVAVVRRIKCMSVLYIITPMLLLGDLILGKYALFIWGREFSYILVRNFVFVGIPYFVIGMLLFKYQGALKARWSKWKLVLCVMFFAITTLLERYFLVSYNINATRDHYLSTTPLAIALFLLFTWMYLDKKLCRAEECVAKVGREQSTGVYIIHPILITILGVVMKRIGIFEIYGFIAPVVVYVCTVLGVYLIRKINLKIRE